jgi:hypothetical protein
MRVQGTTVCWFHPSYLALTVPKSLTVPKDSRPDLLRVPSANTSRTTRYIKPLHVKWPRLTHRAPNCRRHLAAARSAGQVPAKVPATSPFRLPQRSLCSCLMCWQGVILRNTGQAPLHPLPQCSRVRQQLQERLGQARCCSSLSHYSSCYCCVLRPALTAI